MTALGRPLDFRYPSNRLVVILSAITAVGVAVQIASFEFFSFFTLDRVLGSFLMVFLTWALGREYDPDRPATANISAGIVAAAFLVSFFLFAASPWIVPAIWGQLPALITIKAAGILLGLILIRAVVGTVSPQTTMLDRITIHVLVVLAVCALYFFGINSFFTGRESGHGAGFIEYRALIWFMFFGAGLIQLWLCYALWLGVRSHAVVTKCVWAISAIVLIYGFAVLVAIFFELPAMLGAPARLSGVASMIHLAALVIWIPWILTLRAETIRSKTDNGGEQIDPQRVSAGRAMLPMVAVFSGTLFLLVIPVVAAVMRYVQREPEPEMPKTKAVPTGDA